MSTPKNSVTNELAVLFADVSGSTKLYETLGDTLAKHLIDECIDLMRGIVGQYKGQVIKTIGDEVMCVLPSADAACLASSDMQLMISALPLHAGIQRAIRVGWHFGAVIEENGDVYGDTVNLAARMTALAKAAQVVTTRASVERLAPMLRASTRRIAALSVKGKVDDVEVCEIIWQDSDELTMTTPSLLSGTPVNILELRYGEVMWTLSKPGESLTLGRDIGCQVLVIDRMASRQHAKIEMRQGKFMLTDLSTNGTFVAFEDEPEISLRREELMLRSTGRIAFGRSTTDANQDAVTFTVRTAL